jgi:hypothetical protein
MVNLWRDCTGLEDDGERRLERAIRPDELSRERQVGRRIGQLPRRVGVESKPVKLLQTPAADQHVFRDAPDRLGLDLAAFHPGSSLTPPAGCLHAQSASSP